MVVHLIIVIRYGGAGCLESESLDLQSGVQVSVLNTVVRSGNTSIALLRTCKWKDRCVKEGVLTYSPPGANRNCMVLVG